MSDALTGLAALGPVSPVAPPPKAGSDPAIVGARVAQARKRAGLTGAQLGAALGLGKDQISKIEKGKRRVRVRELPKLAQALGVAASELLGEVVRPRLAMAHRLVAGAEANPAATRQRALQLLEVEDVLLQRAAPVAAAPSPAGTRVLAFAREQFATRPRNRAEAQRQGRRLAEQLRTELELGGHEIGDLAGLIEREFGVDVAVSPLGEDADGLCMHGDSVALIVASSDFTDGHVRFTLAHELGHHLIGDPRDVIDERERDMYDPSDLQERRVNAFAGHLLMPEQGIRETLAWIGGVVDERALVALMERFGVSLPALVRQLVELDLLSEDVGVQLRYECDEQELVARHRDLAPTAASITVRRTVRAPQRLLNAAIHGARAQQIGLSAVAALLEREDDDELWREIMDSNAESLTAR